MSTAFTKPNPFSRAIDKTTSDKFSSRAKPTKRVKFYKSSMLIVTQHKTDKEVKTSWYSSEEMEGFRRDKRAYAVQLLTAGATEVMEYMVHSIMKDMPFVAVKECGLGLEHICGLETSLVPRVGKTLLSLRTARLDQVLGEQSRQRRMGVNDADLIAETSEKITTFARDWGRMIAAINEMSE